MIDLIQMLIARNPALGRFILVLRSDSRARDTTDPERLSADAQAWIDAHTPGARISEEAVLISPYPGGMPAERTVTVLAFSDARHLAAFATVWTGDPEPEDMTPE